MTNDNCELTVDELASVSAAATDGIKYLISVSQMKADAANGDALAGALAGALGGAGAKGKSSGKIA
jgi:hypothetical protein